MTANLSLLAANTTPLHHVFDMIKIRRLLAATALALVTGIASAGNSLVSDCPTKEDSVGCLAKAAHTRIAKIKDGSDKVEKYSELLTAMIASGYENGEIFDASGAAQSESSSAINSWKLLLARRNYTYQFNASNKDSKELELLMALTEPTRRVSGDQLSELVIHACESLRVSRLANDTAWIQFLISQCSVSEQEVKASQQVSIGALELSLPMILGYRGQKEATREAVFNANQRVAQYRASDFPKSIKFIAREKLAQFSFLTHVINATALALSQQPELAKEELAVALVILKKNRNLLNDPEFSSAVAYLSWVMTEVGDSR